MRNNTHIVELTCVCFAASVFHLDHVKVILIGENRVHLTVQLFESVLNGVGFQCVIAFISAEEVVACVAKKPL